MKQSMQKFMHGLNKEQKTIKLISNEKSNKLYINDSLAANYAATRFRSE